MNATDYEFHRRLSALSRKHAAMSQGYKTTLRSDGLVLAKPKSRKLRILWRPVLVMAVLVTMFKVYVLVSLGPQDYAARVARLEQGSDVERVGAVLMTADPVTRAFAAALGSAQ